MTLAEEILYGTYTGPNHGHNLYGLTRFIDTATEQAPDLTFNVVSGGALVGARTTLPGIRDGIVDGGLVVVIYHRDDLPYNALIGDMAAWADNAVANSGAVNETTLLDCPGCMAEWEKWNIKHFGAYTSTPYNIICKDPVESLADLEGKKIRGAGSVGRWIEMLGATPVNATISEVYEGMQRGQLDCTVGSPGMMKSFSFWDVAKNILAVPSGAYFGGSMINMNMDRWNSLSDEHKAAYIYAAPAGVRGSTIDSYVGDDQRAAAEFEERGIIVRPAPPGTDSLLEKYRDAELKFVIETAKSRGVENPEEIVEAFLRNFEKWKEISARIGDDGDAFEQALREEIYDKVEF
jgi:TRAP-type C4-dicarboxylate transport system substrate-binding protein